MIITHTLQNTSIKSTQLRKSILGVHSKATNLAVYSELGRYPLFVDRIVASMKYIHYIENETENKLLKLLKSNWDEIVN